MREREESLLKVNAVVGGDRQSVRHKVVFDAGVRLHDVTTLATHLEVVDGLASTLVVLGESADGKGVGTEKTNTQRDDQCYLFVCLLQCFVYNHAY